MAQRVVGEMYYDIDGQLGEIKRQLRQPSGYPFNPLKLQRHLQDAIEGQFPFLAIVPVDRSKTFNLAELIGGKGWTIWRGPRKGNGLKGEEEQDGRSLALTEVDLRKVFLKLCQKEGTYTGEERLKDLKEEVGSVCVRLDMQICWTIFRNQHLIPESWSKKISDYAPSIFFDGTVLRNPHGGRSVLELRYNCNNGKWCYGCESLALECYSARNFSAVLL